MATRPKCPKCGATLGILVYYSRTKVHALKEGNKEWSYSDKVLAIWKESKDDSAHQRFACPKCDWADWGEAMPFTLEGRGA